MPKVELISNISHYYHTALSLHDSGFLGHYITGPCALDSEEWMSRFGKSFKRLWDERLLKGIPPDKVRRMWIPEIVQKGIKKLGGTSEQSNWASNELFSRKAAWMMEDCDAVHFVHTIGREAAIRAKRSGAKVICDMREEHPQFQEDILSNESNSSSQVQATSIEYSMNSTSPMQYSAHRRTQRKLSSTTEFPRIKSLFALTAWIRIRSRPPRQDMMKDSLSCFSVMYA
jgi:hypothetical protein